MTTKNEKIQFNLSEFVIGDQAKKHPNATALKVISQNLKKSSTPQSTNLKQSPNLKWQTTEWTYQELDLAIRSIANGLIKEGLKKGDFLPLRLKSDTTYALTFFGAIAAGIIPIPLSPQLTSSEVDFFLDDTGAKHIALSESLPLSKQAISSSTIIKETNILTFIEEYPPLYYAKTYQNDPAFLIYSSGTTNKPKGVLHAQRVVKGRLPMQDGWHQIEQSDNVLHAGDFNWTYTLGVGLMDPWIWGATALIYSPLAGEEKAPELWPELIKDHKITIFAAVPGIYRKILKYANPIPEDLQTLRHGLTAGEALHQDLKIDWETKTGIPLYEALGQSEISTYASTSFNINCPPEAKGRIQSGRKITILKEDKIKETQIECAQNEEGLIAIHKSDPGLMLQYWNRPNEMKEAFRGEWFITGDRGSIDENNHLTHLGRADDVMNAQGVRVSPLEVETCLLKHPSISEAAVFEKRISSDLSIISALLVLNADNSDEDNTSKELTELMKNELASYKHPKSIKFVSHLPRNNAGKLLRKNLNDI